MTQQPATPSETIEALLDRSARPKRAVPIRRTFLQQGTSGDGAVPGPIAEFVTHGDETALDLWLLARAVTSGEGHDVALAAQTWARALEGCRSTISTPGVSKALSRLEGRRLITRGRSGRWSKVTVLREDGSGAPYTHPGDNSAAKPDDEGSSMYFQLPYEYWLDGWCAVLTLPEKAMLLISLSLADGFYLPVEKVPQWYGFSADSAQRGLAGLVRHGLLDRKRVTKKAPLAPSGLATENHFTVLPPFDRLRRGTVMGAQP